MWRHIYNISFSNFWADAASFGSKVCKKAEFHADFKSYEQVSNNASKKL